MRVKKQALEEFGWLYRKGEELKELSTQRTNRLVRREKKLTEIYLHF